MGHIGELKGLITVVTFLGVFAILVSMMYLPSQSYKSQKRKEINVPEYFEAVDVQFFAETYNFTIEHVPFGGSLRFETEFEIGGWNIYFSSLIQNLGEGTNFISSAHFNKWWIFKWSYHWFKFYGEDGVDLGYGLAFEKIDGYCTENQSLLRFSLQSDQTQIVMYLGWNQTKYGKPSNALHDNAMTCLYCISFDKVNTSLNVWNLIAMLMFFQMPNIHPIINVIIAIPIWVTIIYLITVIILKIIPFVGD